MIILVDREFRIIRGKFDIEELPIEGIGLDISIVDGYLESILNVDKVRAYKDMIYIRCYPIRYAKEYIKIGSKIEFTYKSKWKSKGEVKHVQ